MKDILEQEKRNFSHREERDESIQEEYIHQLVSIGLNYHHRMDYSIHFQIPIASWFSTTNKRMVYPIQVELGYLLVLKMRH